MARTRKSAAAPIPSNVICLAAARAHRNKPAPTVKPNPLGVLETMVNVYCALMQQQVAELRALQNTSRSESSL